MAGGVSFIQDSIIAIVSVSHTELWPFGLEMGNMSCGVCLFFSDRVTYPLTGFLVFVVSGGYDEIL